MRIRFSLLFATLISTGGYVAHAEYWPKDHEVVIKWEDHGEIKQCRELSINIKRDGHPYPVARTTHGILLSSTLESLAKDPEARLLPFQLNVRCDDESLEFPSVFAGWFGTGFWIFGVDYPPYAHAIGHAVPERGTWVSYFDFEPEGGDGPEMSIVHDKPFPGLYEKIAAERAGGTNEEKYDDAYAKAVFGIDYKANHDLLLAAFTRCAVETTTDPEDCGSSLGEHLINLYWRGDDSLLGPMVDSAAYGVDVLDEMGWFYAQLLSRRPALTMQKLEQLPNEKREIVCRQAGEDEFWSEPPRETEPVGNTLDALGAIGQQCWSIASEAAKHPYGR